MFHYISYLRNHHLPNRISAVANSSSARLKLNSSRGAASGSRIAWFMFNLSWLREEIRSCYDRRGHNNSLYFWQPYMPWRKPMKFKRNSDMTTRMDRVEDHEIWRWKTVVRWRRGVSKKKSESLKDTYIPNKYSDHLRSTYMASDCFLVGFDAFDDVL